MSLNKYKHYGTTERGTDPLHDEVLIVDLKIFREDSSPLGIDFKGDACALEFASGFISVFESNRANLGTSPLMLFRTSLSVPVEYASIHLSSPTALLLYLSLLLSVFQMSVCSG